MSKDNITKIKETKKTQCFSYEVVMLVHIIADDETVSAKAQLDEKGGIVTKRDVKLVNTVLFTEKIRINNGSLCKSRKWCSHTSNCG
jgi:acyl-ACP thioesterase